MATTRQRFAERRFAHAWTPSAFGITRALGRSPHNVEFDASPGTSGHIRYFTFETRELLLQRAGLTPLISLATRPPH